MLDLARSVRPTETLAGSMLLALHLEKRRDMLAAFLDALGVPHVNGLIADDHDLKPPTRVALQKAAKALSGGFPADQVELYLATLYILDRITWADLATVLGSGPVP